MKEIEESIKVGLEQLDPTIQLPRHYNSIKKALKATANFAYNRGLAKNHMAISQYKKEAEAKGIAQQKKECEQHGKMNLKGAYAKGRADLWAELDECDEKHDRVLCHYGCIDELKAKAGKID